MAPADCPSGVEPHAHERAMGVGAGAKEPEREIEAGWVWFPRAGVDRRWRVERRALGGSVQAKEPARAERRGIALVPGDRATIHQGRDESALAHREPRPGRDEVAPADDARSLDEDSRARCRAVGGFVAVGAQEKRSGP